MITKLSIRHFKAIAQADIPLGPVTVLVGPNDSGKSTILQALMALSRAAGPARLRAHELLEFPPAVVATHGDASIDIELSADGAARLESTSEQLPYRYALSPSSKNNVIARESLAWNGTQMLMAKGGSERVIHPGEVMQDWAGSNTALSVLAGDLASKRSLDTRQIFDAVANDLRATLVRLDARAVARASPLGEDVQPSGAGVVGIIDELLTSGVNDEQIGRINEIIQRLSPHVMKVAARRHPSSGGKELHFALRSGAVIPASQMSDGIVLATALAVIALGVGTPRLLIEEPENGLHPRQLKVVADTIRSIAEAYGTQIVMTTHSPLLLNHFGAEEVVLVTRDQSGVRAQCMSQAQGLDDLASEMALGELWYNVGDNDLARPA